MRSIIILLLLSTVLSKSCTIKKKTRGKTNIFANCFDGNKNNNFFAPNTHGNLIYSNPLEIVTNKQFRNKVNNAITCVGEWCEGKKYTCNSHGNKKCYHVEHIIDMNGPEYENIKECKNVAGNKIMASGEWNQALGGLARSDYLASKAEKISVYGIDRVNIAIESIRRCANNKGYIITSKDILDIPYHLYAIENSTMSNATYSEMCDTSEECTCDSDYVCGCDCDFELETEYSWDFVIGIVVLTICSVSILSNILMLAKYFCCNKKNNNGYTHQESKENEMVSV
jgi:hypothetical protein